MMDLKDLQYFLAVAQAGTITGAAAKLCMAQPPLSRQMKELEEELGTTLFIRGKRHIRLTEEGIFLRLRHKFLMAQESDVSDVSRLSEDQLLKDLELIPLPGHFFQMIGIRTPDDTVFLADCLSSRATLEKYRVSFIYDVAAYLETLDKVASMKANLFVPAHAEVSYNVAALASYNRDCVMEIKELLLELCRVPRTFETLLKEVFDHYGLVMTFQQHVLVGSTIRSYLSWLKDMGEMEAYIEENCLYWRS